MISIRIQDTTKPNRRSLSFWTPLADVRDDDDEGLLPSPPSRYHPVNIVERNVRNVQNRMIGGLRVIQPPSLKLLYSPPGIHKN